MKPIISITGLGKKYPIKHQQGNRGYRSLRDELTSIPKKIFFPNDCTTYEDFWALQNIDLDVMPGELIGIIGHNGAGKSTLLKILSRITEPSTGKLIMRGRIASLLEVGTGFHRELTGRENIFLNGSILGMSRVEVREKFDEIVDFSGVEQFLDTPVKRYSSGMHVRLAFAVAAHLEPEILIIDEVLAVGDVQFQKKCLGKITDVSQEGRTVLFVSHNLDVVTKLCSKGILLDKGKITHQGPVREVIEKYISSDVTGQSEWIFSAENRPEPATIIKIRIEDQNGTPCNSFPVGRPWQVKLHVQYDKNIQGIVAGLGLVNEKGVAIRTTWSEPHNVRFGKSTITFMEDQLVLAPGQYQLVAGISIGGKNNLHHINDGGSFHILDFADERYVDSKYIVNMNSGVIINRMNITIDSAIENKRV